MKARVLKEGSFHIVGGDFTHAGVVSSELKSIMTGLGISPDVVRRAAIATFEAEMNVIIHAVAGVMQYSVYPGEIRVVKLQTTSLARRFPARSATPAGPPTIRAVYSVPAARALAGVNVAVNVLAL